MTAAVDMRAHEVGLVAAAIGIPASDWPGQCFGIASVMVEAGLVDGTAVYGHYLGPVAEGSMFYAASCAGFVRHGWVQLADGSVIDPTRWVFEDVEPYIFAGSAEHYDEGGNRERSRSRGRAPSYDPGADVRVVDSKVMSGPAWTWAEKHLAIDALHQPLGILSVEQLRWLAHTPPADLGQVARPMFEALIRLDMGACIPIDNLQHVERTTGGPIRVEKDVREPDACIHCDAPIGEHDDECLSCGESQDEDDD